MEREGRRSSSCPDREGMQQGRLDNAERVVRHKRFFAASGKSGIDRHGVLRTLNRARDSPRPIVRTITSGGALFRPRRHHEFCRLPRSTSRIRSGSPFAREKAAAGKGGL
jgi:hypothetical protein